MSTANWTGLGIALATCLLACLWVTLLFAWDQPHTRQDRRTDILREWFDGYRR